MTQTLQKNIRFTSEQWERIETAARERGVSPNQLVIDLAIETLERCEWPRTESEMKVARASLFAAQALARDLIANGREHEVQEIREFTSTIVPDVATQPSDSDRTVDGTRDPKGPDSRP